VLVTLVVLSVGMLGLAALCVASVRASRAALLRTQAVTLAADMADRMRANRAPANAYDCGGSCAAGTGGNAIAIADLTSWRGMVETALPDGVAAISFVSETPDAPGRYTVAISWTDTGNGDAATFQLAVDIQGS
jgi:type IV pilus assembly protein PilV